MSGASFAFNIPWLAPRELERGELDRYFFDQILLLRVLAASGREDQTLQLRYWYEGGAARTLHCMLLGRSRGTADASRILERTILTAAPRDIPLDSLSPRTASELRERFEAGLTDVVEIRRTMRRLEHGELRNSAPNVADLTGVMLPWVWTPHILEVGLSALTQQQDCVGMVVNLSPAALNGPVLFEARRQLEHLRDLAVREPQNSLANSLLAALRDVFREMTDLCLKMRVFLASWAPVPLVLADLMAGDLSRGFDEAGILVGGRAYELVRPAPGASRAASIDCVCLRDDSLAMKTSGDLRSLFSPREANVAFRFPLVVRDTIIADW